MQNGYHHGSLRRALLDAAREMLSEGIELSLRGVARRAGVSHAAPYHHFPDRGALIAAVAQEGLSELRDSLLAAGAAWEGEPARQLVEAGVAYVRFAIENPPRFRLMFSAELSGRKEALPELQAAYAANRDVLMGMVAELIGPGAESDDVSLLSLRAWSIAHGLANLFLDQQVKGVSSADDAERLARRVLQQGIPSSVW